jgi:hypothetical protein
MRLESQDCEAPPETFGECFSAFDDRNVAASTKSLGRSPLIKGASRLSNDFVKRFNPILDREASIAAKRRPAKKPLSIFSPFGFSRYRTGLILNHVRFGLN